MLKQAMAQYVVASREHTENVKAQYTDKTGVKNFFRASELGTADRKLIYGFFKHTLPHLPKSAHNIEQLINGDYVHSRFQKRWEDMGILISMEERLSSKDDEYLAQFPWEMAGHYDGELDVNVIRAHALGLCEITSEKNEETGEYEVVVSLDDAYAESIGIFEDDYVPTTLIADIKTMNPWGWKRIFDKGDLSSIDGYMSQIMFYMYMKNTPYGNIYIESKDNNMPGEVQVLWKDMHEDVEYTWDEDIFGKQEGNMVRVVVTSDMFFGTEEREGVVQKVDRLWNIVEELRKAEESGDAEAVSKLIPNRCSDKPDGFPCSWKTGACEFFDHCWSQEHEGLSLKPYEACPPEHIWKFEEDNGEEIKIDNRKVPQGVDYDGFINLVGMGVLDYTKFLVDAAPKPIVEVQETALNADNLFSADGELNLSAPLIQEEASAPNETTEYVTEDGSKAIDCINCGKQITYQKLGNGNTKKCPFCKHTNRVVR